MPDRDAPLLVFYGGTFDPVHLGHLAVAQAAHARLGAPVWLLPSADPPHRAATGAGAVHRAAMLALAVEGRAGLGLELAELEHGVPTRTLDTLRRARTDGGVDRPIAFVLGADSFRTLPTWQGWPGLLDEAHWVVAGRAGHSLDEALPERLAAEVPARLTGDARDLAGSRGGRILVLDQPLHAASATRVRALVASGGDWRGLVPPPVADYIVRHHLYMAPGAVSAPGDPSL